MDNYSEQETIDDLEKGLVNIERLYNTKCLNWIGSTSDTKEYYANLISNKLLRHLKEFDNIKEVTKQKPYCVKINKNIQIDLSSENEEEIFSKRLIGMTFDEFGEVVGAQITLRDDNENEKIDLVSYDKDKKILYLHKLKYKANRDTLLKTILESFTFFKLIDKTKLINDCFNNYQAIFNIVFNSIDPKEVTVLPTILLYTNSVASANFEDLDILNKLRALSDALGIKFFDINVYTSAIY